MDRPVKNPGLIRSESESDKINGYGYGFRSIRSETDPLRGLADSVRLGSFTALVRRPPQKRTHPKGIKGVEEVLVIMSGKRSGQKSQPEQRGEKKRKAAEKTRKRKRVEKNHVEKIEAEIDDEGCHYSDSDRVYYSDYVLEKIGSDKESVLDEMDYRTKVAAANAFPSIVGILCRNLPDDMAVFKPRYTKTYMLYPKSKIEENGGDLVFWGCGIIIECEQHKNQDSEDLATSHSYFSTIICAATLFVRTDGIQPPDIKVDVYLWDGKLCKGQVLAWDFHINLAAVRIQSDSPLPTATLRGLDVSTLPTHNPPRSFQLLPHSNLYKISPGTKIITLSRTLKPLNAHVVGSGVFGMTTSPNAKMDCNELYWVQDKNHPERNGGAVINYSGEVIGLLFYDSPFLPINIVSSWWNHFKSFSRYHRPWLGVEIANLQSCSNFPGEFMRKFPNVAGSVVVTKVVDSPAYCSGIRLNDVIVKCDGIVVRNTLEFFEIVWNKVGGESVELEILRASDAETLKISLAVEETAPDKYYQWRRTFWKIIPRDQ